MHGLDLVQDRQQIDVELEDADGNRETVTIAPVKIGEQVKWVDAREAAGKSTEAKTPLYLRDSDKNYFEYLEDERVVYVKYNAVQSMKGNSISRFFDKVFTFVDEHPVDKFILDIRHNSGGNNNLNRPIIYRIIVRGEKIDRRSQLYCIIGRQQLWMLGLTLDETAKQTVTCPQKQSSIMSINTPSASTLFDCT